jgi:putative Holliday junction resolvase
MRYLGIDYGDQRTGLAVCDPEEIITSPLGVFDGKKGLCEHIAHIVKEQVIEAVVVGLPLNMNGTEGGQAKKVQQFVKQLHEHVEVPIYLQDERLSSFSAEQKVDHIAISKGKKKKRLDAIAAAEILEAFLEKKSKIARE